MLRPSLLVTATLLGALACNVIDDVVARSPEPTDDDTSDGGAAGSGGGSAGSAPVDVARPRGPVRVVGGKLVSDEGTQLRGLAIPVDVGFALDNFYLLDEIAQTTGLNAIHVYVENWTQEPGTNQALTDSLVSLAAGAGLYVVLARGGGPDGDDHPGNGWFDLDQVLAFWQYYAPRYKDSSHVLYEIQNNPELTCTEPLAQATIDLQIQAYQLIRKLAPKRHTVLFSFSGMPELDVFQAALDGVEGEIDWSNASIAMHAGLPCLPLEDFPTLSTLAEEKRVALTITQLSLTEWAAIIPVFEAEHVGWFNHKWLTSETDLELLRQQTSAAGLEWCPDLGDFPLDASECRP